MPFFLALDMEHRIDALPVCIDEDILPEPAAAGASGRPGTRCRVGQREAGYLSADLSSVPKEAVSAPSTSVTAALSGSAS